MQALNTYYNVRTCRSFYSYVVHSPIDVLNGDLLESLCTMHVCQDERVCCVLSIQLITQTLLAHQLQPLEVVLSKRDKGRKQD